MFGCGTGVVVVAIGEIQYEGQTYNIPSNPIIRLLRDTVTGIQRGKIDEGRGWSFKVPAWDPVGGQGLEDEEVVAA